MLNKIIRYFLENRVITILILVLVVVWGISTSPFNWHGGIIPRNPIPVDAIPDIGDNQQIVATEWMGRSPKDIQDQITYPLTTSLLGIPGVKSIRSSSMFGMSFIYIIFDDNIEFYWSRSRILEKLNSLAAAGKISDKSRILFVNDGSKDKTWDIIRSLAEADEHYRGVCLSRNRGHQNALLAGLMTAKDLADVTISIDCDGQDDINAMDAMIDEYLAGMDVVYGVRSKRETDTWFKRTTAEGFYKVMKALGADVVFNHADYRLLSKRALEGLAEFREVNLFLRGLVPLVGYRCSSVYYERAERIAGESHYPLKKMLAFAFDGITSLSVKPLRLITLAGMLVSAVSFVAIIVTLITKLVGFTVTGWTSMICAIYFLGGVQLLGIGVIGEYVGKIYNETKARPRFIISETTFEKEKP